MPVLDAAGAEAMAGRAAARRAVGGAVPGENEPVDPVAGHIPGAVSAPTAGNVNPDGTFRGAAELAARFAALGARPGPAARQAGPGRRLLRLRRHRGARGPGPRPQAGIPAALYVGSWSNWITDPARPVATGG